MDMNILLAEHQVFETERLILRKIELSDASDMYEYISDEETVRYTTLEPHDSIERTKSGIVTYFVENRLGCWGIIDKTSGKFIGTIDFRVTGKQGIFGWMINKNFWGRGITAEAAACLMKFGFEILKLQVINAEHYTENPNSGRVMEKIGMKKMGQLWRYVQKFDKCVLADYWAITKEEYEAE